MQNHLGPRDHVCGRVALALAAGRVAGPAADRVAGVAHPDCCWAAGLGRFGGVTAQLAAPVVRAPVVPGPADPAGVGPADPGSGPNAGLAAGPDAGLRFGPADPAGVGPADPGSSPNTGPDAGLTVGPADPVVGLTAGPADPGACLPAGSAAGPVVAVHDSGLPGEQGGGVG